MDRRSLGFLLAILALCAALVAPASQPANLLAAPSGVAAQAVNFNLNYSDPASDVAQMWTSNNTHVTNAAGYWVLSPAPSAVNLLRLSSTVSGSNVYLYLRVQGTIATQANVTYDIRMYTRTDNSSHYVLTYQNGSTNLRTNLTGSTVTNLTSSVPVPTGDALGVTLAKSSLGNITAWNIDATAKMVGRVYTYEDFVWSQPGNPGSAPAFIQGRVTDAATAGGLANVNVSTGAGGYFTTTNATGYYSLPAAPGTFNLSFVLTGYQTVTKPVTVSYQQTQTVNAALSKIPPAAPFPWLWIILGLVVLAAVVALVLVVSRRRKPKNPPQP